MKKLVLLSSFMFAIMFSQNIYAQYQEVWDFNTNSTDPYCNYLGCENMDSDPELEFVLRYDDKIVICNAETSVIETTFYRDDIKVAYIVNVDNDSKSEIIVKEVLDNDIIHYYLLAYGEVGQMVEDNLEDYFLKTNPYPNPFKNDISIEYTLKEKSNIIIRIYDGNGKIVKVLNEGKKLKGTYVVVWDGKNESDNKVTPGLYYYTIQSNISISSRKIIKFGE